MRISGPVAEPLYLDRPLSFPPGHWPERLLAGGALLAALPVMAACAITIYALSGKAPFVLHRRLGRYGEPFWMLKLRTMWGGGAFPEEPHGIPGVARLLRAWIPDTKPTVDQRVTSRFARFCRRYSLDELPQLLHVLSGQMSLVGPRPITVEEMDAHYGSAAAEVLAARPGLTGLWQVCGRSRLTYAQRRRLDLFLVRKAGAGLTLLILGRTLIRVCTARDAR